LLARNIVSQIFSETEAKMAEKNFDRVFKEKKLPDQIPEIKISASKIGGKKAGIVEILFLSGLVSSKSEAKRMISQKAVKVDGKTITDINIEIEPDGKVFKVGKRKFGRVSIV
ncbi:MAG: S4 domain-containing protein, partial [Candidatus Omnitrophica bacterium]|nr:S4 domain-containing protein [Candidatus Omnitrophota bacterium]